MLYFLFFITPCYYLLHVNIIYIQLRYSLSFFVSYCAIKKASLGIYFQKHYHYSIELVRCDNITLHDAK